MNFFCVWTAISIAFFVFILSSFCVMVNDKDIRRNKINKFPHLIALAQTLAQTLQNLQLLYLAKYGKLEKLTQAYTLIEV